MKHKILVVDDSKTISMGLKNRIETQLGLDVYVAASMKECADLLLKHKGKFDLALLDRGLPDAANGEVVTFVNKFKIPSLLLTGTKLESDDEIFKNPNLIDYIVKNGAYAIDYSVGVVKRFILNSKVEVLVIDDSKTFALKMQTLCKKYNLSTIVSYRAKEALDILKQRPNIKLVLVDYNMPEMDGLQFTMEARKTYKKDEIAIIALSGMSEKEIVASFLKYGANDFLYKDFSNEEFFARVNSNIEVLELFNVTQDKAKKDYLTGLFNKDYFFNAGAEIYDRAKSKNELLAVILIEINEYEIINESYGHEIGDEANISLANLLLEHINKDSIIARLGAGQFAILYKNRAYAEIYQTFDELKDIIKDSRYEVNNETYKFSVSISANIDFDNSLEHMVDLADEALENIKFKKLDTVMINS